MIIYNLFSYICITKQYQRYINITKISMEDLIIEQNIPVPDKTQTWQGKLDKLEVGESFSFPSAKRNSVRQNVSGYFHAETNKRFTVSTKGQPKGKARVWRIDDAE